METIGIITCCLLSLLGGFIIGLAFNIRGFKQSRQTNETYLMQINELKKTEKKYQKIIEILQQYNVEIDEVDRFFEVLLCRTGDLIHGIAGYCNLSSFEEFKELARYWPQLSLMGLAMREGIGDHFAVRQFVKAYPEEKELINFLKLYKEGEYNHLDFLDVSARLLFGNEIKNSLCHVVQKKDRIDNILKQIKQ